MLSIFSVLPAEKIEYRVLKALFGSTINSKDLDTILRSLHQKSWLDFDEISRSYKCSPVIQEIVKNKNQKLNENCKILIDTLINKLEYDANSGHLIHISFKEASLFVRYAESIVRDVSIRNYNIGFLFDCMGNYFKTTGELPKALQYYTQYNQLREELFKAYPENVGYKNGLAVSYSKLGSLYRDQLKDNNVAIINFKKAEKLWFELVKKAQGYKEFENNLTLVQKLIKLLE